MQTSLSGTFSAAQDKSGELNIKPGESFSYSMTTSGVAVIVMLEERAKGAAGYKVLATKTATTGVLTFRNDGKFEHFYRLRCEAVGGSETATYTLASSNDVKQQLFDKDGLAYGTIYDDGTLAFFGVPRKRIVPAPTGKIGATSGFVVAATDNISLATCPASKTASTLVIPVQGLRVGEYITGFELVGQIESAGNTVTVDAALRKLTSAASDVVDALVGSITQLSVVAETVMGPANAAKTGLSQLVGENESYYILVTVTTGASCDLGIQSVVVTTADVV